MSAPGAAPNAISAELREQFSASDSEFNEIISALNSFSIVAVTDRRGIIMHANDRFCEISKYSREELIGQTHSIINSGYHPREFFKEMWRVIGRGDVWKNEICNRAKDGSEYWVDTTIIPLLDGDGRPQRYISIRTEETQRHLAEEQAHKLAYCDRATGLSNRASMLLMIGTAMSRMPGCEFSGFIAASVDDLSVVNDAFGYEVGDRLLLDAAQKLTVLGEDGLSVARIGSNTFAVLLPRIGSDHRLAEQQAAEVVHRVLALLSGPVDLGSGVVVDASASVGYVLWAAPGIRQRRHDQENGEAATADGYIETADPHEVIKCADIARKRARRAGGHRRMRHFRQSMLDDAQQRVHLVSELRRGIENRELRLFAQPIVDRERRVIGEEGLIRWLSPARGLVPPGDFIPLAEQTGIIVEIGEWVLDEACRVLAAWKDDPERQHLTLSVNLSERQLRVEDFAERVSAIIARHGVTPGSLKFELTESVLHTDLDRTIRLLSLLRAEGVLSSLDDFGTGYSSLSYMRHLPVQQIKIDRSFVMAVGYDEQAAAIARTIVQLGRSFELQVVAEGVETEAQFEKLRDLGVDAFQGFLFARPRPVDETLTAI
ncbi:putative bifunctional diguanylate cyclase/phosphodiesterase [Leucobacter chironomi]|uniref:putative bifunctional diguanylate cyclase/phosphodiesterase n=1 Tax=Leucobacter chironomi TaxID=491918 RepID=UPI0004224723|nr:GGDEF domain-containing phosphodiesterase [Leucobacter chironomi]